MKKVYYWEQIFLLKSLGDYETLLAGVIQKLLAGEYASADIEKLQHQSKSLFSARINEKARMIFTNIQREGVSWFCRKFFPKRKAGLFWTSLCRESIELFKNSLFSRLDMLSFS